MVSIDSSGEQGNGGSRNPSISADGRYVAFDSWATDLVPDDTNGMWDVFLSATSVCAGSAQPGLSLSKNIVYWASYDDYTAGLLSVDYGIVSTSSDPAYQVTIAGTVSSNGVTRHQDAGEPAHVLVIIPGETLSPGVPVTLKYDVPAGVASFSTTVYATALDGCGNSYSYPGPYPGP